MPSKTTLQDHATFDTIESPVITRSDLQPQGILSNVGKGSSRDETFDATKALAWLEMYGPDFQRNVRSHHLKYLASEMSANRFQYCAIKIAVLPSGRKYLIDGQHRLWAIAESRRTIMLAVLEIQFETLEQVKTAYADTDNGLIRTPFDALSMLVGDKVKGRNFTSLNAAVGQMIVGWTDTKNTNPLLRSKSVRVEAIERYAPYFDLYRSLWAGGTTEKALLRAPVASVAMMTLEHQQVKAMTFWRRIALNDGLQVGSAEHTLHRWIAGMPAKDLNPHIYSRYVALAWNYYMEDKKVQRLVLSSLSPAIKIEGTPFDGTKPLMWGEF